MAIWCCTGPQITKLFGQLEQTENQHLYFILAGSVVILIKFCNFMLRYEIREEKSQIVVKNMIACSILLFLYSTLMHVFLVMWLQNSKWIFFWITGWQTYSFGWTRLNWILVTFIRLQYVIGCFVLNCFITILSVCNHWWPSGAFLVSNFLEEPKKVYHNFPPGSILIILIYLKAAKNKTKLNINK